MMIEMTKERDAACPPADPWTRLTETLSSEDKRDLRAWLQELQDIRDSAPATRKKLSALRKSLK